jgi:hypothetical protein
MQIKVTLPSLRAVRLQYAVTKEELVTLRIVVAWGFVGSEPRVSLPPLYVQADHKREH